jgi:hypothetical protein
MQTITGKIIKFLPRVEGESQKGPWVKAGFVIEYGDEYPTKAAFTIFGEQRLQQCAWLKEGMDVTVNFNPQSREYNDRWYTDLQCVSVFPIQQQQPTQQPVQQQTAQAQYPYAQQHVQQQQAQMPASMSPDQDLPF